MAQKVRKWKRLETEPQEIDIISEAYQMQCPFCKAYDQKFISYSKEPFRVGVLCTTCSTIYYAEFVDSIEIDISADKLVIVLNKIINSGIKDFTLVMDMIVCDICEELLKENSYFNEQEFKDACYKVHDYSDLGENKEVKEEVNGTN